MAFSKKTWKDRVAEYISRRTLTYEDGTTALVTVSRSEGTVSEEGDPFNAETMNDLESRIQSGLGKVLTAQTLTSGETTLYFYDSSITTDSVITPYASVWGVSPKEINTVSGTCTLLFDALDSDVSVFIKVESGV